MSGRDLLIIADGPAADLRELAKEFRSCSVSVLEQATNTDIAGLPDAWERVDLAAHFHGDAFRRDFLSFLHEWPIRRCWRGRTFDALFRRRGGYSVWWTSAGAARNPNRGIVPVAKKAWILDRVLASLRPRQVAVFTEHPDVAWVYSSRCGRARIPISFLRGSATPTSDPWRGRAWWLARSIRRIVGWSFRAPLVALCARLLARTERPEGQMRQAPVIVFSWRNADYWRIKHRDVSVWFWKAVCDSLTLVDPHVRHGFLVRSWSHVPGRRGPMGLFHWAWKSLRHLKGAVSIPQAHPALGTWFSELPGQALALRRYAAIEQDRDFRESFVFAGADLAPLYVPRLREAVASSARWAQSVAAVAASIRSAGNVKALVVAEEMYPPAMIDIAAAKEVGIPAVGVQHATIFPMHFVYTLPPGQVRGAPIPDRFAVYGEFAKETVCRLGAYPAERVWMTGATRLDHLVTSPPDSFEARRRLGLPADKQIVLIPTQTAAWFPSAVRAALDFLKGRRSCLVCLKIHPKRVAMPAEAYRNLAREVGADNVLVFDDRYEDLLAACDVLVSASSTTVLEAILLGRTTICANFSGEAAWYPYGEDGGSLPARNPQEMREMLEQALDHPEQVSRLLSRDQFLHRHAGATTSGEAATALAYRLLGCIDEATVELSSAASASRAALVQRSS